MRPVRLAPLILSLILGLVGCSRGNESQLPVGVLFQDDFTDGSNWILETDLAASAAVLDGQLLVVVDQANLITWAELEELRFDDFVLDVEATQVAGPDNNSYGVIFRMRGPSAYYRFDISGDGYFAFSRLDDEDGGRWVWITDDWLESSAIRTGASTNQIKIVARGATFEFFVNGQKVAQAEDDTYRSGAIGLDAGAFHEPGVQIAFDNLKISEP